MEILKNGFLKKFSVSGLDVGTGELVRSVGSPAPASAARVGVLRLPRPREQVHPRFVQGKFKTWCSIKIH